LDGFDEFSFIHGSGSLCGCGMGLARENPLNSKGFFDWRLDLGVAGVLFPPVLRGLEGDGAGGLVDVRKC
jgi:hypothetical protein